MKSTLSHIEINVLHYAAAIRFYDLVLVPLGYQRTVCTSDWTSYSDGAFKIILGKTEAPYRDSGFHRKRAGLNHLAFKAETKAKVDDFYAQVLQPNDIPTLYQTGPFGDNDYYAVFFEGPDRLKLELVYAPNYCDPDAWPSNIPSDFDPYNQELNNI